MTGPGVVTGETMQPDLAETGEVQEKQPPQSKPEPSGRAVFRVWRGDQQGGKLVDYTTTISPGMVVLDVIHQIQAEQANDLAVRWNCKAGKCGSCSAEVNGSPKLMCMTRLSELPLDEAGDGRADARLPSGEGPGHRRLLELQGEAAHQAVHTTRRGRP